MVFTPLKILENVVLIEFNTDETVDFALFKPLVKNPTMEFHIDDARLVRLLFRLVNQETKFAKAFVNAEPTFDNAFDI